MKWSDWLAVGAVVAMVASILIWFNVGGIRPGRADTDRVRRCNALAGEPLARLHACYAETGTLTPSDGARAAIQELLDAGSVLGIGARIDGLDLVDARREADLEAGLLETDEADIAEQLRRQGIVGVVVHRDLMGALDRDRAVVARLAYHDHLDWFDLRYVTEASFVYAVRPASARLALDVGDRLLRGLRARLQGTPRATWPSQTWRPGATPLRLIGTVRLQGNTLASRHVGPSDLQGRPDDVERALDALADKLRREWERHVEPDGHGRLDDRLGDARFEIHVVTERAPVDPRSRRALFELWEMGVDGMMFRQRLPVGAEKLDEKFTYMPGSELMTRSMRSADEFLHFATDQFGWFDRRPWEVDRRTRLEIMRDQHFMEAARGGGPAIRLVRGAPEVPMDWITDRHAQDMLVAGGEWWLSNERPDGSYEYKYWPVQNRRSTEYNEVRHILATRDLADTWRYRHDPRYLRGSRVAMDWLLRFLVDAEDPPQGPLPHPPSGTLLFRYPSYALESRLGRQANQKLGTVAVALLGWVEWARATGSHAEDERIRRMARFVTSMQEPDGRFRAYLVPKGHSYEFERNDIVPGEAMLALGEVAEYFDEAAWVDGYDGFLNYYRPWFRERAQRKVPTGRWPHDTYANPDRLELVQFGPWSVMAAKQVYAITGDEDAAEFGLEVADWMIDNYQWSGARSPWPDYVGGYYKLPFETPAMQSFCYAEGTAAAYTIASRYAPERKARYEQATAESVRFLEVMQFDDLDSYFVARPDMVRGGVKYTMNENKVRIDYVGHGLSTLSQWLDARAADPAVDLELFDPADLQRPAGSPGSVPGLDYGGALWDAHAGQRAPAADR